MTRIKGHLPVILFLLFIAQNAFCQKGKDGAKTITANAVVNEYTSLQADVDSGTSYITVANNNLNFNNRFNNPLDSGDLLMIIQVQGATISGSNDSSWGNIISYNNCGLYEFAEVAGVSGSDSISFLCGLKNNYTASGNTEVIRVPRFSALTLNAGGTLTGDAWNGATGGIISVEVQGNMLLNAGGTINATGIGFRGGVARNAFGFDYLNYGFVYNDSALGGEKGEGIGGFMSEYNSLGGAFGRGSAANGGGGGNAWNCPGGGGANAGDINLWTGNGNPDTSKTGWITAWNLEAPGFAHSTSSGGGRGGYATVDTFLNPTIYGPDNVLWSFQTYRSSTGGKGGRPLDYSGGRIYLGGGGGAAQEDNNKGGSGGNGGGIIFLYCNGTISGSGTVTSNGAIGGNDNQGSTSFTDAPGGGGAGGTIILNAGGTISGISANANGGTGGNQQVNFGYDESAGGGGGGGGGYIAISNGNITRQAPGGANGTTNAFAMVKFPPNGATKGASGLANETIAFADNVTGANTETLVALQDTLCAGQSGQLTLLGSTGAAVWQYATSPGNFTNISGIVDTVYATPPLNETTYYRVVSGTGACSTGSNTVSLTVVPLPSPTITVNDSLICSSDSANIQAPGNFASYVWNNGDTSNSIYAKSKGNYWVTVTDINGCSAVSNHLPIKVYQAIPVSVVLRGDTLVTVTSAKSYQWYWNNSSLPNADSADYVPDKSGNYSVLITDTNGCVAASNPLNVTFTGSNELSCDFGFKIYPNPTSGSINIFQSASTAENLSCAVFNVSGQRVADGLLNTGNGSPAQLDISQLSPGMYFVELRTGEKVLAQKIIIEEK